MTQGILQSSGIENNAKGEQGGGEELFENIFDRQKEFRQEIGGDRSQETQGCQTISDQTKNHQGLIFWIKSVTRVKAILGTVLLRMVKADLD